MQIDLKTIKYLYWTPRILGIIFILFLAVFALDVFIPGKSIDYYVPALFMHLIPNFILAAVLILAWKHEKIGGTLFILLALAFTIFFKTYTMFINFLMISFPVFLIGGLFLLHNYANKRRSI